MEPIHYKVHPWHGISIGNEAPNLVTAFIEIVPTDTVKYEIDKQSGYLKVDRPQKFSNIIPALYGFIPQTYSGKKSSEYSAQQSNRESLNGDNDPLDICVLSERNITHGDIILKAIPIGGFRLIDKGEADDKIVAVMAKDEFYTGFKDISDIPSSILQRLKHYFLTYKNMPGIEEHVCEIVQVYGREEALKVIELGMQDYKIEILKK